MKKKKHRFVHPDPERVEVDVKSKATKSKKANLTSMDETGAAQKDLKNSLITIVIFTIILAGFYFLDRQYNFFEVIKNVI
jgi:hypothetical protein